MQARSHMVAEDSPPVESPIPFPEDLDSTEGILHAIRSHVHRPPAVSSPTFTPAIRHKGVKTSAARSYPCKQMSMAF